MDLITAGITCFNAQNTIEAAVRSAQAQTWQSLEIVVADDHSTDGSPEILERFAADDERIRLVRHAENRGVGAARNSVLEAATGEFVAFFDDDDRSRNDRLAAQYDRITRYERETGATSVACCSATERTYPDGSVQYAPCLGMDRTPAPAGPDVARLILLGKPVGGRGGAWPTSSQMARRAVYRGLGGFDGGLRRHEDTDFNLRLALAGGHFAGLSRPLVRQTVTITGDKSAGEERRHALATIEKHRDLLQRWGWYDYALAWWDVKFTHLEDGAVRALPKLARLFLHSPLKTVRKILWTLPNRGEYKRYRYDERAGGE